MSRKARNRLSRRGRRARSRDGGHGTVQAVADESRANLRFSSPRAPTTAGASTFRHDEIRDFHGNVRLDYGYAMTIASAQGLTVDRAFLLVDDRPARETIYPAATRHREGIDVYVNRSPLAFDIAERRPEDEAEHACDWTRTVRGYLAERWSRSEPKEAALDYVAGGAWRDPREAARNSRARPDGMRQAGTAHANAAANDNALDSDRGRHPPCGRQRLAPRRCRRRIRGRAGRSSGRLGRPPRARPGRGRYRSRSARPSARPSTATAR